MPVCLDTSAPVKLYVVEEDGGGLVCRAIEEAGRIVTSTVAYAEARSGFARKRRKNGLDVAQLRRRGLQEPRRPCNPL